MKSLRSHLVLWLMGTLVLGIAAVALATYHAALHQIGVLFDDELMQIARAVHLREDWVETGNVRIAREDVAFAVRAYDEGGRVFFESGLPALPPDAPKTLDPGFSMVETPDGPWRVYTHVVPEGVVQVAQAESIRDDLARELSLRMLLPLLLFIPVVAALIAWVLKRSLAPLHETSARVRERDAARLDPLPTRSVPAELLPLVSQVNALLARLSASLEGQRRFVADAAHELRSPVAALALQVQLAERAQTDAARAAALAELRSGISRAGRLVQQLLDLARLEPGVASEPPTAVDLAQLVREVIGTFAARADRQGVDLGAEAPASAMVRGSPSELCSLVANLVDNALRYAPPQSAVTVSLRETSGVLALIVEDAGPGIPADQRQRVLERFQRVEGDAISGSGLGLPIAKAIVERHRGDLTLAEARPGRQPPGLSVQVHLPTAPAA
ncbi:MAG: sensory histidine kinase [Burkholderiales bacterium]|nr:sensory histidine kinase [Burkholderiales bacterium]